MIFKKGIISSKLFHNLFFKNTINPENIEVDFQYDHELHHSLQR